MPRTAITAIILLTLGPVSALAFHVVAKRVQARRIVRRRLFALNPEIAS